MPAIYTYIIPNQWSTKVQSLRPNLTHYVHVGGTYIATDANGSRELANLYIANGQNPEVGLLEPHPIR